MSSKIIAVSQQKGGVGKSTIASNLAVTYQMKGFRVLLVDADNQRTTEQWYHARSGKKGAEFTGIKLLVSSAWKLGTELDIYKRKFDIIIIDSPPHMQSDMNNVLKIADLVLMPIQMSVFDLWAVEKSVEFCNSNGILYKLVINRMPANRKEVLREIKNKFKEHILDNTIGNRVAFVNAVALGLSVVELDPKSTAADEIAKLTSEIAVSIGLNENEYELIGENI